ncbi:hypothetical protein ACFOW1_06335 [Parasediminibacterium paludis]|uniref:Uncharacterized protein n=1 Tax=Parasediminibacterium paludis TaxID=908966 RepID=A0ABV8PTZ9_9BACT
MVEDKFELTYGATTIAVERFTIGKTIAYKAVFSSKRPPLVLTRATNFELGKFWTSIPEGRQKEAEGVGEMIEDYLLKKQKD